MIYVVAHLFDHDDNGQYLKLNRQNVLFTVLTIHNLDTLTDQKNSVINYY